MPIAPQLHGAETAAFSTNEEPGYSRLPQKQRGRAVAAQAVWGPQRNAGNAARPALPYGAPVESTVNCQIPVRY